jgi:hypothetical protein
MNHYTYMNEVWYSKRSWTYVQVLFESLFSLTKLLNIAMVHNFEVTLGQMLTTLCLVL